MSLEDVDNALGTFLRARRELVRPEDVGLSSGGRRRVPGLRREELATLAGISIDYYVRLERGRDRHPSASVLASLARVLRLDHHASAHLHALARPVLPGRPSPPVPEPVRPAVARVVEATSDHAAFLLGRTLDVLAANALAEVLHPGFRAGQNLVRFVFLDPRAQERYVDWHDVAADAVATLRGAARAGLDDPALIEIVGELSLRSEPFRRLWARHDVRAEITGRKRFENPHVGRITLDYESFAVSASPGQCLVVYSARPGSSDELALKLLTTVERADAERPVASRVD